MDRRSFLKGVLATAAATQVPVKHNPVLIPIIKNVDPTPTIVFDSAYFYCPYIPLTRVADKGEFPDDCTVVYKLVTRYNMKENT